MPGIVQTSDDELDVQQVDSLVETPVVVEESTPGAFRLSFSPQEFADLWATFTEAANAPRPTFKTPVQGFASSLVETLVFDPFYAGKMDYNSLRMGTAPILKELGINGGLSDAQIIELFAEDEEGNDIIANPEFFEGMKRRAAGAGAGTLGFFGGMYGGNWLVSGVPPITPWTAAVRLGVPIIGGIGGYIIGSIIGDAATEAVMGREPIMIPGPDSADYKAGIAAADAVAFMITPWMAPAQGANLGARIVLTNMANFIGPIVKGVTRTPLAARAVLGVESLTASMGGYARTNPYLTGFIEASAAVVSVKGAHIAETISPDNPWIRFTFEAGGGLSGAVAADLAARRIPQVLEWSGRGVYNLFKKFTGTADVTDLQARWGLSEEQLRTAGNFIIEQLEKNGENPAELLRILNDPSFNKWLVDEAGNKIELDPATRTASVTLLALQNQFIDAAPGAFGNDASARMRAAVDALRRALLAMYADGSPTALSDAALLQTSLFESVLDSKLAKAINDAQEAMRRVRPEGDNVDLDAAEQVFTILEGQYTAGRSEEQLLWKQIPRNVEIVQFINEDGVTQGTPNFISKWDELLGDETPEIRAAILKNDDLNFLNQFVARKNEELGLTVVDGFPPPTATVLPEQRRLNTALDKIAGTSDAELPQNIVSKMQADGASLDDILKALRREADTSRGRADVYNTPGERALAKALDAQANLLSAQRRQAQEFSEAAAQETEIIGLNAYELVRTRGRALAMGRRLNAAGLNEEARIANEMADAMLADLNSMGVGVSQAYDTARSYSRAFNDVFTRAYAGEVLGTKKNGAPKIPIATIANNMMNGDAAFMRAAQLDGIAQFQVTQSLTNLLRSDNPNVPELGEVGATLLKDFEANIDPQSGVLDMDLMRAWYGRNEELIKSVPNLNTRVTAAMNGSIQLRSAEETLLRTIRANTLNPDGTLNVNSLSNWRNNTNNERLLDMFPSIKSDLNNVTKAANLLENTIAHNKWLLAAERKAVGLYELLPDKTSNAATAITLAISPNQTNPFKPMNRFMRMIDDIGVDGFTVTAKNSPNTGQTWTQQDLKDALRKAIYDSIFSASDGVVFRPDIAYNRLFARHPNAEISIADWMKSKGLIGEDQLKDTQKFLRKMGEIQAFTMGAKPGHTAEFFQDIGEGIKILAAMGGSVAGTHLRQLFGSGGSGSLVAAGRGATFGTGLAQKYMAELPQSLQASRVSIILANETLLKLVLKTGRTKREKSVIARQLEEMFMNNYIVSPVRRVSGEVMQTLTDEYSRDVNGEVIPSADVHPHPLSHLGNIPRHHTPTNRGGVVPTTTQPITAPVTAPQQPPVNADPSRVTPIQNPNTPVNPSRTSRYPITPVNPSRTSSYPITPISSSGPVDRARFAAFFPEDRELMGIGSLMVGAQ
jgi:hypothetical protein